MKKLNILGNDIEFIFKKIKIHENMGVFWITKIYYADFNFRELEYFFSATRLTVHSTVSIDSKNFTVIDFILNCIINNNHYNISNTFLEKLNDFFSPPLKEKQLERIKKYLIKYRKNIKIKELSNELDIVLDKLVSENINIVDFLNKKLNNRNIKDILE